MLIIAALGMLKEEDRYEFEAILGYTLSSRLAWMLSQKKKKNLAIFLNSTDVDKEF